MARLSGRCALAAAALAAACAPPGAAGGSGAAGPVPMTARTTYVIVHGAWGGGWDWRQVDSLLIAHGHRVYRVTLTGLGERAHLASADIRLETHITDVVNTLLWEELRDVVLVGHSYGGMVITGAADRVPARIARLVYIDAMLPVSGESVQDMVPRFQPLVRAAVDGLIPASWEPADRPVPRDVGHPVRTFTDTLVLANPAAAGVAGTYILTSQPHLQPDHYQAFADRAAARGWPVHVLEADHVPERSAPGPLVELLLRVR